MRFCNRNRRRKRRRGRRLRQPSRSPRCPTLPATANGVIGHRNVDETPRARCGSRRRELRASRQPRPTRVSARRRTPSRRARASRRCPSGMRRRDEPGLERARRQVDAGVEHRVEEAIEALLVAGHHRVVGVRDVGGEVDAEHAAHRLRRERNARAPRDRGEAIGELPRPRAERVVESRRCDRLQRGEARRDRRRDCPTACPPDRPGPSGAIFSMIARSPPNAPTGMPPPITLPSVVRSGVIP